MPTERTKPSDTATERVITGGPGYDFSQEHIYWDREDIFFDNETLESTERTKPTTNQALSLTGSGYAYIADASQTGLDMGLTDFMVEMRVKLTIPSASQPEAYSYFFSKYAIGSAYYEVFLLKVAEIIFFVIDDEVDSASVGCSTSYVDDLGWHTLFFVADRSSTTGLELYIDGVEPTYDVQEDPTSVGDLDTTGEFTIGTEATLRSGNLNGQIDESRIWSFGVNGLPTDYADYISWRHINPLVPTSHYNGGSWNTYVTNNLSAYYKFNGNYTDETSNSNDLTTGGSGNTFLNYSPERIKESDTAVERTKESDTAIERTKET